MVAAIRVNGLTKRFGATEVLRGIDCAIDASEVVCVIGPSGSGKSTFLRCLNGLEESSGGEVLVGEVSVHHPGLVGAGLEAAGDAVEQGRFSDIRPTDDGDDARHGPRMRDG